MDSSRWNRIQELFAAALERPADERAAFLRGECGDDGELFGEVWSLLDADAEAPSLLDGLAIESIDLPREMSYEGSIIGPYRVVRLIGSGGMADVYLAERADGQFDQRVALKLIRRGMDSEQILRRFQSERQILARLEHSNIARLLDGGVTPEGLPYFSLEYIAGERIDKYCDARRLSVDARLELFKTVCGAVQYAHNNLIVHRDLKPANVLVTNEGVAKLLDFGIAKVLDDSGNSDRHKLTRTGGRVMTPRYASPEQFRGEPVTTATDVYSLGVILYELLTGRGPHVLSSPSDRDLEEAICSTNPDPPSVVVQDRPVTTPDAGNSLPTPQEVSAARQTQPDHLQRRLSGDLDNICLMALRKAPERRYQSAAQLLDDVQRHLDGLPVLARRDTWVYRTTKFVRRHRASVAIAFAVLIAIAGLTGYYTMRLADERDRAMQESQKARQVTQFLTNLFEISDPSQSKGEVVTAREILDQGALEIDTALAGQPEMQAEMKHVVGRVYVGLGLYREARDILTSSLAIQRMLHGGAHSDISETLYDLASATYELGDYKGADTLYGESLRVRRRFAADDSVAAEYLNALAAARRHQGDYDAAESLYTETLALRRSLYGGDHPDIAHTLNHLARLQYNRGNYEAAEPLFRQSLAMRRKFLGDDNPEVAASLAGLSGDLAAMGQYDEAITGYREVIGVFKNRLGEDHPYVGSAIASLARTLLLKGDYDGAEPAYREALTRQRQALPKNHPSIANTLLGLGRVLIAKGELEESETLVREALETRRSSGGAGDRSSAEAAMELGRLMGLKQDFADAETLLKEAHATLVDVSDSDDELMQTALQYLIDMYDAWGKTDEADEYRAQLAADGQ